MKQELINYYNILDNLHKDILTAERKKKKQYGFREGKILQDKENIQNGINVKNIKEQKLHIKRLIKLMEEK